MSISISVYLGVLTRVDSTLQKGSGNIVKHLCIISTFCTIVSWVVATQSEDTPSR